MKLDEDVFIPMNNDLLFKEALCHVDNRKQLIYFIKSVTKIDEDIIKRNLNVKYESVIEKTRLDDKVLRGDVIVTFDKYIINLENYSYFDKNSLLKSTSYIMRIFSTQLDRGKTYESLENIIQINIIENDETNFFDEYVQEFAMANISNIEKIMISDKFRIKYYNIDKINAAPYNELNEELRWIKFIGAKSIEERREVAKGDKLLMEMNDWIDKYIKDEKTKEYYGKWAEWIAEQKGIKKGEKEGIEIGIRKGIKKGIKEGIKKNNIDIVKKMKEEDLPLDLISKITGLGVEEIEKI